MDAHTLTRTPLHHQRMPSSQLKRAIEKLLAQPGAVKPDKARFFRGQMQTIISKALTDMAIKPVPSRRCFTIMSEWLTHDGACKNKTCFAHAPLSHANATPTCLSAAWLEERLESVYKQDPRFNDKSLSLFSLDMGAPEVGHHRLSAHMLQMSPQLMF